MIKFIVFLFLVIPTFVLSLVLIVSLARHSTLFNVSEEPQFKPSLLEFSQPGLSRRELNRIIGQVTRAERSRARSVRIRPIYSI
ncbi:MAG: hypothetical protein IJ242_05530 [Clostridia bacterium]|nr:hypothetical protein [Clostridia bacterium]